MNYRYPSIAKLNNEAVICFQKGNHDEAILILKTAIKQIVGILRDCSDGDHSKLFPANDTLPIPMPPNADTKQSLEATLETTSMGQCSKACGTHPISGHSEFMFPIAIERPATSRGTQAATTMYSCVVMLPEDIQDATSADQLLSRTSISLLYNLAFIHHFRAFHMGTTTAGFQKALQFYSMAITIISPTDENLADVDNVAMAIWNNMGHLYSQLFQLHEARVCFDRLRYLLASRSALRLCLPKQDYETFLLNAMFQGSDLLLAPAA